MTGKTKRLYRFRPLNVSPEKSVIDELRARELFLGTLEQNNDPMDGIQDAYWEGDEIVWRNFIKHYCLCLLNAASFVAIAQDTALFKVDNVTARATPDSLPETPIREIFDSFYAAVATDRTIESFLGLLIAKKRVDKGELRLLLDTYHSQFMNLLDATFREVDSVGLFSGINLTLPNTPTLPDVAESFKQIDSRKAAALAETSAHGRRELQLISLYQHTSQVSAGKNALKNLFMLLGSFPAMYLDACVKTTYDEYYIACFSESNDNESMWGHYASGHQGVCLIFEFEEKDGHIQMELEEEGRLDMHKVRYCQDPPQINVFECLGYLPMPKLYEHWLSFEERLSSLVDAYRSDAYHAAYWDGYKDMVCHKFPEWEREQEYRAVKTSWFSGRKSSEERLMHYKDTHLKGIIFGMRTPIDLQLEIIDLLKQTLSPAQKSGFEFHSASYCSFNKKLRVNRLGLLKFAV